jgi:hypothetical protein
MGLETKGEVAINSPVAEHGLQVPVSNEGKKSAWVSEYKIQYSRTIPKVLLRPARFLPMKAAFPPVHCPFDYKMQYA